MTRRNLPFSYFDEASNSPFFHNLQQEMNRVFERFTDRNTDGAAEILAKGDKMMLPPLDVAETDDAIELTAEMPGVKEEDLDISISDGVLLLKGEKRSEHEEKEENYHLVERRYGSFRRSVPLGFDPAEGKVDASFENGILKLKVEKPAETVAKTQKISVSTK